MTAEFENEVEALKMMSIGCIMAEYGCLKLLAQSKQDLKQRVKATIKQSESVQNWFKFHHSSNQAIAKIFTQQFNDSKIVLLAALFKETFWFSEDTLEHILEQIRVAKLDIIETETAPSYAEGPE